MRLWTHAYSRSDFESHILDTAEPGSIVCYKPKNAILVRCKEGFVVGIELQIIGTRMKNLWASFYSQVVQKCWMRWILRMLLLFLFIAKLG